MSRHREEIIGQQRLILGDCLEVLPTLEAGSVDAVVTDPPYGTGGFARTESGKGPDFSVVRSKREAWDVWDPRWLEHALRIARYVVTFAPQTVIASLWGMGPQPRQFVWCKPDPFVRGKPPYAMEPVIAFGERRGTAERDWFVHSAIKVRRNAEAVGHQYQKPLAVMAWLVGVATVPGDTVIDPFLGSGTTLVAAERLGRRGIGIEIDAQYFDVACRRVEDAAKQPRLFTPDERARPEQLALTEAGGDQ